MTGVKKRGDPPDFALDDTPQTDVSPLTQQLPINQHLQSRNYQYNSPGARSAKNDPFHKQGSELGLRTEIGRNPRPKLTPFGEGSARGCCSCLAAGESPNAYDGPPCRRLAAKWRRVGGAFSSWSSEAMMREGSIWMWLTQQGKVEEVVEPELAKVRMGKSPSAWCCGIQRYPFCRFL